MTRHSLIVVAAALAVAGPVYAHHSFAKDYDERRQVSLEGEVVSVDLRSPHSWVYFTAADETGVVRRYGAEWASRNRLTREGVGGDTIKAGDHVVVTGAPNRSATAYSVHLKGIRRPSDGWSWPRAGDRRGGTTYSRR